MFHIAADYRLWAKDPAELYRSNVEGTRNLLTAAREAGVERVVYTSTVGCIGIQKDRPGSEDVEVRLEQMTGAYKRSKFQAEQVAIEFARAGLPVVIVNPTAPMGDHDFKPTPTGKIVVDYLKGAMPAFVDTGLNLVDVEDTAEGHLLAAERGEPGERYILGCENLTLEQILGRLARISDGKVPRWRIPYPVAYAAGLASTGWANLTGQEPRAPLDAVKMAKAENVRFVRQGEARIGIQSRSGGWRPQTRRRLVSGEWLRLIVGIRGGGGSRILGPSAACGKSSQAGLAARFRQENLA